MATTKLFRSACWALLAYLLLWAPALDAHGADDPYLHRLSVADSPKEMFDAVNAYGRHMGDLTDDELRWAVLDALEALEMNKAMRRSGCDRLMINSYIVFRDRGIYDQFWELMSELLVREDIMPEVLHPAIYFITGETYYGNGYYHSAIDNLTQFVEAASVTQHESNLYCNALTMISLAHKKLGDLDKAFIYAQRTLDSAIAAENEAWHGLAIGNLGVLYRDMGDDEKAMEYLKEDLRISRKSQLWGSLINLYSNFGQMALSDGQDALAAAYADSIEIILKKQGFTETHYRYDKSDLLTFRAQLAARKREFQKAYRLIARRDSIRQMLEDQNYPSIDRSQFKLVDLHSKNLQIQLLESNLRNEELEKRTLGLVLISAGVLIVALIIFSRNRSRMLKLTRKSKERIEQQKEQILRKSELIEVQKTELENSNQAKDKLFSVISHDLKSPVLAIKDFFGLAEDGLISKEEMWELVPELNKNISALYRNTEQLLHWSRSQLKGLHPNSEQHSVTQLLKEIRELLEKSASNKSIELNIHSESPTLSFYADITHIKLVLSNILSNAIKFSPKDSTIYLRATPCEDAFICLEVVDEGPGISPMRLEELQTDQPVRSERGSTGESGTGLGLAISRQFITANKGKMTISSVVGEGTRVSIWIPAIEPH